MDALLELKIELDVAQGEWQSGCGEVLVRLALEQGGHIPVRLGRDFMLDGELAERLTAIPGIDNVELGPRRGKARLKLVA